MQTLTNIVLLHLKMLLDARKFIFFLRLLLYTSFSPIFGACIEIFADSDGTTSYGYLNTYPNSDGSVKLDKK